MADDRPGVAQENDFWFPNYGIDPAKYLVNPGRVRGPGDASPGQLAHVRPYIANGSNVFVFPATEGFSQQGQTLLGLHRYIGDVAVDGVIIHREEGRITLDGTFPGLSAQDAMVDCRNMLRSIPHAALGLVLYVPGVFEREQYVLPESWNFTHSADDRSHSIDYNITLVQIGDSHAVADPTGAPGAVPGSSTTPRGAPSHVFTVKENYRTFQAIAKKVYGKAALWGQIAALNQGFLNNWKKNHPAIPAYQIPTYRWPLGTKFAY